MEENTKKTELTYEQLHRDCNQLSAEQPRFASADAGDELL